MTERLIKFEIKDGILLGPYPPDFRIDLEIAKRIVQERLDFVNGQSFPALIDTTEVKSITKEARDYFNSDIAAAGISSAAIIVGSVFMSYIANFMIKVNWRRNKMPMRVFTDKNEALNWLKSLK